MNKKILLLGIVFLIFASFVSAIPLGFDYDNWITNGGFGNVILSNNSINWTSAYSVGWALFDFVSGIGYSEQDDLWVIVGSNGRLSTSKDGETWTLRSTPLGTFGLNGVHYSEEQSLWVLVANSNSLATSSDGISWTGRTTSFSLDINDVFYSNNDNLWVAVGDSGNIGTSPNGITWTMRTSGTSEKLNTVYYSEEQDLWVVGGNNDVLLTSSDGITWTSRVANFGGDNINDAHYSNEKNIWLIVGEDTRISNSTNGITWTNYDLGNTSLNFNQVVYSKNQNVWTIAGTLGYLYNSYNGINWTLQNIGSTSEIQALYTRNTTIEIKAVNSYNGSFIDNFNITYIDNDRIEQLNDSTNNGSVYFQKNNIIDINAGTAKYFNTTYTDWSSNENINIPMDQTEITFEFRTINNNLSLSDTIINMTDSVNNFSSSTNNGTITFNPSAGQNLTFDFFGERIGSSSESFNFTELEVSTYYIYLNPIINITLYDEATFELFNVSNTNYTKVLVICNNGGSYSYDVNTSSPNIAIPCVYSKLRFTVNYEDTTYFRILLAEQIGNVSQDVYLIDLTTTQALYNALIVNDYVGEYTNPTIYVKKNIPDGQAIIHSDDLDVENKISVYLIENDEYILELHSDNKPINILGFYGAEIAGTKEITVTSANIDVSSPAVVGNGVTIYTYAKNISLETYAYAIFNDTTSDTTSIEWSLWLLNETTKDLTDIYTVSDSGTFGEAIFTPYNITAYTNYTIISSITYIKDGESYTYYKQITSTTESIKNDNLFGYYSAAILQWGVIIFLSVIALSGTITTQNYVNYVIIGGAAIAKIFGLFSVSIILLILSLVIVFMFQIKSSEETRIAR